MNIPSRLTMITVLTLAFPAFAREVDIGTLPPASAQKGVTYAKDIKPLFDRSCVECHGGKKPKAKLSLETLEGALRGSADGKVIQPGSSAKSQLVLSAAHLGPKDTWMPPPNKKAKFPQLPNEQVGLIRAWIDQGAK
jgi:hypothetical protein